MRQRQYGERPASDDHFGIPRSRAAHGLRNTHAHRHTSYASSSSSSSKADSCADPPRRPVVNSWAAHPRLRNVAANSDANSNATAPYAETVLGGAVSSPPPAPGAGKPASGLRSSLPVATASTVEFAESAPNSASTISARPDPSASVAQPAPDGPTAQSVLTAQLPSPGQPTTHAIAVRSSPTAAQEEAATEAGDQPEASARRLVAAVVTNTSLLTALVIYMGWAYLDARLGYFGVSPLSLNLGILDYALHSLAFFFNTNIIFLAVVVVGAIAFLPRVAVIVKPQLAALDRLIPRAVSKAARRIFPATGNLAARLGIVIIVVTVPLIWAGLQNNRLHAWFYDNQTVFYLVILLMGAGPLLATRAKTARHVMSLLSPLTIAIAVACLLWAAGLYASNLGTREAIFLTRNLVSQTAVTLYSARPLGIFGSEVKAQIVRGSFYRYKYQGLRLLIMDSGTYYLLPADWTPANNHVYIINSSDEITVEFS